jgi:large subunit ribosomal protein L14e
MPEAQVHAEGEMTMFEIGRVCIKTAGRDAGKACVVIDMIDEHVVVIDGQTRRRKCNVVHLEPTEKTVKIAKDAANADVASALSEIGIACEPKKEPKPEAAAPEEKKPAPKASKPVKKSATKKPKAVKKASAKKG